jgi:hypothetical protein
MSEKTGSFVRIDDIPGIGT